MENQEGITVKKEDDFSEWYTQVIQKSDLIEYTDVSGCYILRPTSYAIWETIREYLNEKIKKSGVKNSYFPLLIPESLLKKEKEHVEGFNPEVAWVTETGDTKLNERLAIRPTSETIMYPAYKKWIRSYKDLPLRLNQWNNIIRWEFAHPVPFLRSREFLWQEGHTAFATKKGAEEEALEILEYYKQVFENLLSVPMLKGKKSDKEKFAGADSTLSVETFLPAGKGIQGATSHNLGQNFSKVFDISFLDKDSNKQFVWQNSWGLSTRSIGIMIAMHSDNNGLILPPKVAYNKLVIVPIIFDKTKNTVLKEAKKLQNKLKKYNPILDDREDYSAGWKFNEWELKGIPIRIEIGPKDISKNQVILVRRDTLKKETVRIQDTEKIIEKTLESIQSDLFKKADKFIKDNTLEPKNINDFKKAVEDKRLIKSYWCKNRECEDSIKEKTGAKILNLPFEEKKGKCIYCGKDGILAYFAKSY
ncbi:MAG: proline--tRNA ligase [archaeon]